MPMELEHVSYAYQTAAGAFSLRDISLRVDDGEFVGVMGPSGCGKTTLLQLMAGLVKQAAGRVLLDGQDIHAPTYDKSQLRRKVGVVFQHPECQLFETTVEKDVAFALRHSGLGASQVRSRVRRALEAMEFSFDQIRAKSPLSLSGGEKRRVAIAGVLVADPKILLFDEPIAGLDPQNRQSFLRLLTRLRQRGASIVMVSHNVDVLGECADRLVVISRGTVAMDAGVRDVFSNPARLHALKLRPCAPQLLAHRLKERGFSLPPSVVTYEELRKGIIAALKGGAP